MFFIFQIGCLCSVNLAGRLLMYNCVYKKASVWKVPGE